MPHQQAFEIRLFIKADIIEQFTLIEDKIHDWLAAYTNTVLNETPPFDELNPTIENMGRVFFNEITDLLSDTPYQLEKLDISDSPQRVLSFSEHNIGKNKEQIEQAIELLSKGEYQDHSPVEAEPDDQNKTPELVTEILPQQKEPPTLSKGNNTVFVLSLLFMVVAGFVIMEVVRPWQMYPLGFDIHGHLFKSDELYKEIQEGNFYPLYNQYWYNGIQLFRYWPPMTYYIIAALQFLVGGDVIVAYLAFIWLTFTVGGIGWIMFGKRLERPILGLFFGVAWFFLPDNLRVLFGEGNLPRVLITTLIPFILYFIWCFVRYGEKRKIFPLIFVMLIATFTHLMISAMIGVGCFIFLLIYSIMEKSYKPSIIAILAMLFSFAVMGFWVYPALIGGLTNMASEGTSDLMISLAEPLSVSLNPTIRINNIGNLYFGLSIAVIAVLGLFLAKKKSKSGFLFLLIIIAGTTTFLTPIIAKIPYSELFWVRRFAPLAYGTFVIGLLEWRKLRKPILVLFCLAIGVDAIPSTNLAAFNSKMNIPARVLDFDQTMDDYLFQKAKDNASQRVSLMDLSQLGPFPSYAFGSLGEKTPYTFGWAWQGASTALNIAYLNEALELENYIYLFDRHVELGADEIIINKINVGNQTELLFSAAKTSGYTLTDETDYTYLFSLDVEGTFGVISDYKAMAIGSTAALVPFVLPFYRMGDKMVIDEYTIDELSQYDMLYLSGFFYNDKEKAETLVEEVSKLGVKIYIDMSRIPIDPLTNRMNFLKVDAQPFTFKDRFPQIITKSETITPLPFQEGYEIWNTVYLTGLEEAEGYVWFDDNRLDAYGSRGNVYFMGFNLFFHSYSANDTGVKSILTTMMSLDRDELPNRTLVPLDISYERNQITINSEYDNVNTTIAIQDIFESEQNFRNENNMLVVDKGTTIIKMQYPYLARGITITIIGIIAEVILIILLFKPIRKRRKGHGKN